MQSKLEKLKDEALSKLKEAKDQQAFKELETQYLGRKGELATLLKELAGLAETERRVIGELANEIKRDIQLNFELVRDSFVDDEKDGITDVTIPGPRLRMGHEHPISIVQNELEDLFVSMGFMVLEGPELESDYFNFEALNIPKTHPARDMQDTFFIDKKNTDGEYDMVMRTHTSPVQVRAMLKYGAPLRCVVPGRVFRSEATDVRHEHTFSQFEGLMIGEGISFAEMKGVLSEVGKKLFGPETKLKMRPKFYPFVEPGSNGEYTCFLCRGEGCRLCKHTGWLEIMGCGLVHPNVLRAGGIDPDKYTGFAFGYGLSRLAMLKFGIEDTRLFNSGDMRFLEQF